MLIFQWSASDVHEGQVALRQHSQRGACGGLHSKFNYPPEKLPLDIRDRIHFRNYLRRQWQSTRDPELRSEFYQIKDEIVEETKQHLLQKRAQQIESLTPESRTLWTLYLVFASLTPALAPIEKAEVIADSLRKQFEPDTDPIFDNSTVSGRVKEAVGNFVNTSHINNLSPVTASEVYNFIKTLKSNKSTGLVQISNRMLKDLPLKFILYLTFHECFNADLLIPKLLENCCDSHHSETRL
ncbi:hypothetical protein AVEN_7339-1 [Araneus ventricosus]|uniref:Uncharacterized protein n=1 Tax=Araneus ventricosus TaxID=182803 RepID=A0A4Y2BQY4_ARAVE|nr:hypothetical protein AVEN_7339-1 [Araneus ventricosus]